jgi:hypothetical protein
MYIGSRSSCAQHEAMIDLYRVKYNILRRVAWKS